MEEMVPVVDENNNIVEIVPRSFMRKNKLPHRASYIVLSDGNGRYYIEKRTMIKVTTDLKYLGWKKLQSRPETFTYAGVFYGEYQGELKMQESEVDDVLMLTAEEVLERSAEFTPDSLIVFKYLLDNPDLIK